MPTYTNKYITLKRTSLEKYIKNNILGNIKDNDSIDDVIKEDDVLLHTRLSYNFSFKEVSNYVLYFFFAYDELTRSVSFSNLETLNNYSMCECFDGCTSLETVYMNNLKTIGTYGMDRCFRGCTSLTTAPTFANLTSVDNYGLQQCFYGCTSLTTAPTFASLTSVGGPYGSSNMSNIFYNCTSLTIPPSFINLTNIGQYALSGCFSNCTSLTTAPTFANLTNIENNGLSFCFSGCTSLTTAPTFTSLTTIGRQGLYYCFQNTKITSLSFPSLTSTSFGSYTNQFQNMLQGVTGCTVHFPSNLQSVIGSWTDVTNGFGGTNTTVLFDLPATT